MQAPSFDIIKKNLDEFDQSILKNWEDQLLIDADSSLITYVADVPDFPTEKEALITDGNLTLERIALDADPGEEVDKDIPLEIMEKKFAFPPTPCERPQFARIKKKKSKKKKSKSEHGKEKVKGKTPRSESTTFGSSKKNHNNSV
ncbi:hypothetical protein M9Y10_028685 [Tritrichomonas musculus]|uniref:Uncharacterized protein n=1 Tax=Tritrichomonas musculus TaxID=1915356 RepID=A0ABR2KK72_9EUKA